MHKFRHNFQNTPDGAFLCSTGSEASLHFLLSFVPEKKVMPIINKMNKELKDSVIEKGAKHKVKPLLNT